MRNKIGIFVLCFTLCYAVLEGIAALAAADIGKSSGILLQDANQREIQFAPQYSLVDGTASAATITNLALTSNVVTITATHNFVVGQQVTIALLTGPTLFADCNGTFTIASVSTTVSFTYAFTHANISTGAATGTATAYMVSPMPTNTTSLALKFPDKAVHLVVVPTAADARYSKVSGAATGGTFTLFQNTANHIDGVQGDTVYIQRSTTTPLEFVFDLTR